MLDRLARILARPKVTPDPIRRHLAMAVMLVETARADYQDDPAERETIRDMLVSSLGLDETEARNLVDQAFERSREAVSLHSFLSVLNNELDLHGKRELMEWLWRVAYADGHLDPLEEARVRQLADLLFISHADFVRLRLQVEEEVGHPA